MLFIFFLFSFSKNFPTENQDKNQSDKHRIPLGKGNAAKAQKPGRNYEPKSGDKADPKRFHKLILGDANRSVKVYLDQYFASGLFASEGLVDCRLENREGLGSQYFLAVHKNGRGGTYAEILRVGD